MTGTMIDVTRWLSFSTVSEDSVAIHSLSLESID